MTCSRPNGYPAKHIELRRLFFRIHPPDFQVELIRYTDERLKESGLKEEFRKIILYIQDTGRVSNSEIQTICEVSKATASRYLAELEREWIEKIGTTGVGTMYVLKGLSKGSNF